MKNNTIFLVVGGLVAYLILMEKRAIANLNYVIAGISLTFSGIVPVLGINILIQNVSNQSFDITSFVGSLTIDGTYVGDVSSFTPVIIAGSSQAYMNVKVNLSLIGIVSDLINLMNSKSGIPKKLVLSGNINVNNIVAPLSLSYNVGNV